MKVASSEYAKYITLIIRKKNLINEYKTFILFAIEKRSFRVIFIVAWLFRMNI